MYDLGVKVNPCCKGWLLSLAVLPLLLCVQFSEAVPNHENGLKTAVFLSPGFVLAPGSVANKIYSNIEFPRGHIAIKSFNAEVVDEAGTPIPLHETYLHHWVVVRYYHREGVELNQDGDHWAGTHDHSNYIVAGNSGVCQNNVLRQSFGLGSETRRTSTRVPDPFGIEDGRTMCYSEALYGKGKEAGNEEGYIVGMSTCYPTPGSVRIADGETLTIEANYDSSRKHTGVMALFYLMVADRIPEPVNALHPSLQIEEGTKLMVFGAVALLAVIVAAVLVSVRRASNDGYQLI